MAEKLRMRRAVSAGLSGFSQNLPAFAKAFALPLVLGLLLAGLDALVSRALNWPRSSLDWIAWEVAMTAGQAVFTVLFFVPVARLLIRGEAVQPMAIRHNWNSRVYRLCLQVALPFAVARAIIDIMARSAPAGLGAGEILAQIALLLVYWIFAMRAVLLSFAELSGRYEELRRLVLGFLFANALRILGAQAVFLVAVIGALVLVSLVVFLVGNVVGAGAVLPLAVVISVPLVWILIFILVAQAAYIFQILSGSAGSATVTTPAEA